MSCYSPVPGKLKSLKHVTLALPASCVTCEEQQMDLKRRLTKKEHGMAPQRARWVRYWRLMMKLLPAPRGWPHKDRWHGRAKISCTSRIVGEMMLAIRQALV